MRSLSVTAVSRAAMARARLSRLASRPDAPLAFALAYLACAEVGHALTLGARGFATFWPAAGLYVSMLAAVTPRRWLPFVLAAGVANLLSDVALHAKPVVVSLAFFAANTTAAMAAAGLLQRALGTPATLVDVHGALRLVVTVLGGAALSASLGALTVHAAFGTPFPDAWLTWWSADALGALLVAPVLLAGEGLAPLAGERRDDRSGAHVLGLLLALSIAGAFFLHCSAAFPLAFLFLPPLLWAALRFGIAGGALAMLGVATAIVWATRAGIGPYAGGEVAEQPFMLQTLLAVYALVTLVVSAQFLERRRTEQQVREANETLEQRVAARTERLHASENRYRRLVELAPDPIFVNRDGRIALANRAFLALVGAADAEEVIGRSPFDFIAPELHDVVRGRIARLLATGETQPAMEQTWRRLDGGAIEVEVSAALHEDPEGSGVQVLLRDITERRRVQRALAENEERLRLALHAGRMFAFEWSPATDAVVRSAESNAVTGLPGDVADTGTRYFERIDSEDRARFRKCLRELVPGADSYRIVYRLHRPDGSTVILEESGHAMFDAEGRLTRLVGIAFDVTEREAALAQLRESEDRFATLAYALPAVLFTTDAQGECDYANPALTELTGLGADDLRGEGWTRIVHPEDLPPTISAWRESLATGAPFKLEYRLRRRDGTWRWFKGYSTPVRDAEDRILKWIGVALDVDEQRQAQAALVAADRRKDEFLAMLAHELRNPLGPIRNSVAVLAHAALPDARQVRAVEIIARQSMHLARLVDDLLDVARVTSGKIALAPVAIDLREALQAGIELARPALDAREQHVELASPAAPVTVQVDPTRFAQVIGNLLQNAAKFSAPGRRVHVAAEREADQVAIRVSDEGVGIPPDLLPHVFDLFTQADRSLNRAQGGLGVGLALVKAIVEMHGGRVHAESGPQGSTFTVRLPLPHAERPGAPVDAPPMSASAGRRILVVEDNADAAESLAALLELEGHRVACAPDGAAALVRAAGFRPEVAILDIGLPGMDGYTLARLLRETAETRDCVLVALTGYGQPEDRARAIAAGFDAHLVKPVEPAALERAIADTSRLRRAAA
jgi:PAS domain S-box-containing protein